MLVQIGERGAILNPVYHAWTVGAHRDLYGRDSVCSGAGADRKNLNSNKKPLEAQTEALGLGVLRHSFLPNNTTKNKLQWEYKQW